MLSNKAFLTGVVLGLLLCFTLSLIPVRQALDISAAILVAAGAVYFGTATANHHHRRRKLVLEAVVGIGFILLALLGLWVSPLIMATGYLLHGVWDFFHHPRRVGAKLEAKWYPPVCLGFDWLVGAFIVLKYV